MITVIGESLVDIISDPREVGRTQVHPGGSPLNVAVGVARLGLATTLVTHYADDPHGLLIADHLGGNNVEAIVGGSLPTSSAAPFPSRDATADDVGREPPTIASTLLPPRWSAINRPWGSSA